MAFGKQGDVVIGASRAEASWADMPVGASDRCELEEDNINYI